MFKTVDVLSELQKEKEKCQAEQLLADSREILAQEYLHEKSIQRSIVHHGAGDHFLSPELFDESDIFSEAEIKNICIKYRFRFLSSGYFKGEVPYEAIQKVKKLQQQKNIELKKFKILAPKRLFDLPDADADPMLFAPLSDGRFYLVHKWGSEMKWHRRLLSIPFRNFETLVVTMLSLALLVTLIIPNSILVPRSNMGLENVFGYWGFHRISFFFHFLILCGGMTIFTWFSFNQNFSDTEWNRKTFN